jgi:hypothetical protein
MELFLLSAGGVSSVERQPRREARQASGRGDGQNARTRRCHGIGDEPQHGLGTAPALVG